jgi:hypothetical protein
MELKFFKVATLPGTLEANAIYFVENGTYAESYVTNNAGVARSIGNSTMINALIASQLSGLSSTLVVADIAARNALSLNRNTIVYVINATGDTSVTAGAATYLWNQANSTFSKVAEFESMDVVLSWSNIQGRPSSTPANIDDAVSKRHTHANMAQLDLYGAASGVATYNGEPIKKWNATNW